jgi:4-amino-4-deoxy-L-arabinose transferase-like glycosyltransferase
VVRHGVEQGSALRRPLVGALALATLLRVVVFALADSDPGRFVTKDSLEYDELARRFGAAYVQARPERLLDLSLLRPPGYPALIWAVYGVTGRVVSHVIVVELVLSVATVAGVYVLAERIVGRAAAVVAAFVLAVDPVSIAMSSNLTTETLFAGLWVAAAVLWVRGFEERSAWAAVAGLGFGSSVLVRPIGLYLPVLVVPLTLLLAGGPRARRVVAAAALLAGFALPVGLWLARNAHETGVATISTIEARNLLDYRAADALAIDEGEPRPQAARLLDAKVAARVPPGANAARVASTESSVAWETLVDHPKGAFLTTARGLGRVLLGPGRAEMLRLVRGRTAAEGGLDRALIALEAAILVVVLLLALVGIVVLVRSRRWLALAATLTFAAYDVLLAAGAEGNARLRMPAMPFLAVLAGVGGIAAVRRLGSSG